MKISAIYFGLAVEARLHEPK